MEDGGRGAYGECGVDQAHGAASNKIGGLSRRGRVDGAAPATPVAQEDGLGGEQEGGGDGDALQDGCEHDGDVEGGAGARIEEAPGGANRVRCCAPRLPGGIDGKTAPTQDSARRRGEGVRPLGAGGRECVVGGCSAVRGGKPERLVGNGPDSGLVGLDEGRQRRAGPATAADQLPLPRGQHGDSGDPMGRAHTARAQLDPHVSGTGLLDLEQVGAIKGESAGGSRLRAGGVPGQVPGLGDAAPTAVLNDADRHLDGIGQGDDVGRDRSAIGGLGAPQTNRDGGSGARDSVGVADDLGALGVDNDGVERVAGRRAAERSACAAGGAAGGTGADTDAAGAAPPA